MPGPGPHMMYALGSGQGLMHASNGRFGPHHCITYAINAFFGPDIGSLSEWLSSTLGLGRVLGSSVEKWIHDPFYYALILGLPLSLLYTWISRFLLQKGVLDSFSGYFIILLEYVLPWNDSLCFDSISAHREFPFSCSPNCEAVLLVGLCRENGHSSMYTWILSTGWWETRAPVNPDAVVVIGLLCAILVGGFVYIYRVQSLKSIRRRYHKSLRLIIIVAILYCLWCGSQIYLVSPRRPAVGEEADLGVVVFLCVFFFFPHWLCILSMNAVKEVVNSAEQLPL